MKLSLTTTVAAYVHAFQGKNDRGSTDKSNYVNDRATS